MKKIKEKDLNCTQIWRMMKNLDPNTEPGLIWPEPPWATTIHDMKDRLNISIPVNEPGKSMKEQWAKEHKAYIEKYRRDGSRFNLYTDGSLLFDQGVRKTGFGYVAYHCSKVILRGNGSTGSRVCVCVCVFSFVTPRSRDFTTEWLPYWYMRYNGFIIHGKGQVVSWGGFPLGVGVIWVGSG